MKRFLINYFLPFLIVAIICFLSVLVISCKQSTVEDIPAPQIVIQDPKEKKEEKPVERISLYWENTTEPHPERAPWSDFLIDIIKTDLPLYMGARDIVEICPKIKSLSEREQVVAIGEFWVALAYFESGFNPNSASVDVGTSSDKGSWSVGLYQMSSNDSSAKVYKATFETLKDPLINIKVATEQMRRQIKNTNEIILPNSSKHRYWAIILRNNRFNQIAKVKERVLKNVPSCK